MSPPPAALSAIAAVLVLSLLPPSLPFRPWPPASSDATLFASSKSTLVSPTVFPTFHKGKLLTSNISLNLIWYGQWLSSEKSIIRGFISSISNSSARSPSVYQWWTYVRLYTDSAGHNVTGSVQIGGEKNDGSYSRGKQLTRAAIELIIKDAIKAKTNPLSFTHGAVYVVLTSADVGVERFCESSCGRHGVTTKKVVGVEAPFAWIGNSRTQCPGMCSFPYAVPDFVNVTAVGSPNGDGAVDGMVIVMGHELAEMGTDPFTTGWYYGEKVDPQEVGDLCEGVYGSGGGGAYPGQMISEEGVTYNVYGVGGMRFTLPWLWSRYRSQCFGPNAVVG